MASLKYYNSETNQWEKIGLGNMDISSADLLLSQDTAEYLGLEEGASIEDALKNTKTYADGVKNDLLNGAGEAYDTLKELGELIDENTDALEA